MTTRRTGCADQFDIVGQIRRPFDIAMNLFDQAVEHADLMPPAEQFPAHLASDEAGAAGDEYLFHGRSPDGWRLQPDRMSTAAGGSCGHRGRNIFFNSDVPSNQLKRRAIFINMGMAVTR